MSRNGKVGSVPTSRPPRAPAHLSGGSRRVWRAITADWELGPDALLLLEGALVQRDIFERARRELARAPAVTSTSASTGVSRAHPAAKVAADALREMRCCLRALGLELPDEDTDQRRRNNKGVLYDE